MIRREKGTMEQNWAQENHGTMGSLGNIGHMLPPEARTLQKESTAEMGRHFLIWPIAVEEKGKRTPDQCVISTQIATQIAKSWSTACPIIPLLDHAGPAACVWMKDRAFGPSAQWVHPSGRTPFVLTKSLWSERAQAYLEASDRLTQNGVHTAILGMHDDGLLAATLSPIMNPQKGELQRYSEAIDIFRHIQSKWSSLGICFALEEICPGGRDPTEGIWLAQEFEKEGAHGLWVCGGTRLFPPGSARFENEKIDGGDTWLSTAQWLCDRVKIPLWAVGQTSNAEVTLARAQKRGMKGITIVNDRPKKVKP